MAGDDFVGLTWTLDFLVLFVRRGAFFASVARARTFVAALVDAALAFFTRFFFGVARRFDAARFGGLAARVFLRAAGLGADFAPLFVRAAFRRVTTFFFSCLRLFLADARDRGRLLAELRAGRRLGLVDLRAAMTVFLPKRLTSVP